MSRRIKIALVLFLVAVCAGGVLGIKHGLDCLQGRCPISATRIDSEEGIQLTLWSPYESYKKGEMVVIKATLENKSNQPVVLAGRGEPIFEIEYKKDAATEEYTLWSTENPDLAIKELTLQPGEKFEAQISYIPITENYYSFKANWIGENGRLKMFLVLSIRYGSGFLG